jgi:homoserine kinase type II
MSVYTTIERNELEAFLQHYPVGKLIAYEGISAGIENTNYFVDTENGRFVLTIFESLGKDELPYFLDLMAHLAEHQVPSAHPKADNEGHYLRELKNKPAALVQRLIGNNVQHPSVAQCAAMGKALAHLHVVGQSFAGKRDNERGPHWWHETAKAVMPHLSNDEQTLLNNELHFQRQHEHDNLPRGVIHADLFRDNALFDGDELTGLIDFYYACNDVLLYDVAVTANDWCTNPDGSLDSNRLDALLSAYQQERSFTDEEQQSWPVMLRAAALRFWLSRLKDKCFPREGEITTVHDPDVFKRILIDRSSD